MIKIFKIFFHRFHLLIINAIFLCLFCHNRIARIFYSTPIKVYMSERAYVLWSAIVFLLCHLDPRSNYDPIFGYKGINFFKEIEKFFAIFQSHKKLLSRFQFRTAFLKNFLDLLHHFLFVYLFFPYQVTWKILINPGSAKTFLIYTNHILINFKGTKPIK